MYINKNLCVHDLILLNRCFFNILVEFPEVKDKTQIIPFVYYSIIQLS